jgi:hypothetical protein
MRFDPPELQFLASLHHNLGGLEFSRGRYAAGEPHARRAIAIRKRVLGAQHTSVAEDRAALAAILDGAGKKKEAERLYRSVLPLFEGARMRYDVAVNLSDLGTLSRNGAGAKRLRGRTGGAFPQRGDDAVAPRGPAPDYSALFGKSRRASLGSPPLKRFVRSSGSARPSFRRWQADLSPRQRTLPFRWCPLSIFCSQASSHQC